jgi:WD40 repeat protein
VLASGDSDGTLLLWDPATAKCTRRFDFFGRALALTPDGKRVVTNGRSYVIAGNAVRFHDATTGKELRRLDGFGPFALSPDGRMLAVRDHDGLRLCEAATGKELHHLKQEKGRSTHCFVFSPDGKKLAIGEMIFGKEVRRGVVRVYDVATGRELRQLDAGPFAVHAVAFAPMGDTLACSFREPPEDCGPDEAVTGVRTWNLGDGSERWKFSEKLKEFWYGPLAFSPTGRTLAWGDGRNVRLWEMATGKECRRFVGHRDRVTSVSFSPGGKILASGSMDATILLWDVTGATP